MDSPTYVERINKGMRKYSVITQTRILVHLHVNKTDFHMKGFALGLALKQRRKELGNRLLLGTKQ